MSGAPGAAAFERRFIRYLQPFRLPYGSISLPISWHCGRRRTPAGRPPIKRDTFGDIEDVDAPRQ
eukprot:6109480-Pyramimonas_sp.AAC.1